MRSFANHAVAWGFTACVRMCFLGGFLEASKLCGSQVTDWTNKNLLSDLSLLSLEQRRSLPLILTQKAKCVKGTKDWSMKVKFTGMAILKPEKRKDKNS